MIRNRAQCELKSARALTNRSAPGRLPSEERRAIGRRKSKALREALGRSDYKRSAQFVDVLNQATTPLARTA